MKKVFISYSHEDLSARQEAQKFLVNLEREKRIKIWHDKAINPGERWDDVIQQKLWESDIVILLVSQDFIASTYVHETEMRIALEKLSAGKAKIIPFLLDDCDWKHWSVLPLSARKEDKLENNKWVIKNFQFMPLDDKHQRLAPLSDREVWPNTSRAWMKLTEFIRKQTNPTPI